MVVFTEKHHVEKWKQNLAVKVDLGQDVQFGLFELLSENIVENDKREICARFLASK